MVIRCWGARGSIPVSGKKYLKFGGDTTCIEIRTENNDIIIIDAGSGIRRLGNRLIKENFDDVTLLFTHVHWDHLLGLPFFKPIYNREIKIQLYGCKFSQKSIKNLLLTVLNPPYSPITSKDIKADLIFHENCENPFTIHSIQVTPIYISHPNRGLGFKFTEKDKHFVFLTDNELGYKHPGGLDYQTYGSFCKNANLLIHDSEFTEEEYQNTKKWGHSTYTDALQLATESGVKMFGLFHHNQNRSDKAINQMVKHCRKLIKEKKADLKCFAAYTGLEIHL